MTAWVNTTTGATPINPPPPPVDRSLPTEPPEWLLVGLVDMQQIADELGVGHTAVSNWANGRRGKDLPPFPEPVARFGAKRVWWWPQVRDWARGYSGSTITRSGGTRRRLGR